MLAADIWNTALRKDTLRVDVCTGNGWAKREALILGNKPKHMAVGKTVHLRAAKITLSADRVKNAMSKCTRRIRERAI